MNQCTDYRIEISALLDGESDPGTALDVLEHVGSCGSCGAFVREARSAQHTLDRVYPAPDPARAIGSGSGSLGWNARIPRWGWALAATVVLAVGGALLPSAAVEDPEIVVRLGEESGTMSDDRFLELATELLAADRLYRDQMYFVLDAVRSGEPLGERGVPGETSGSDGGSGAASLTTLALD